MVIPEIIGAFAVIRVIAYGLHAFERYGAREFRHPFRSKRAFVAAAGAGGRVIGGLPWLLATFGARPACVMNQRVR